MVFSSVEFLAFFLPVFLVVYYLCAPMYKNLVLLLASLVFYGYGEPIYVFLMIISIGFNYLIAEKLRVSARKKLLLFLALFFDFGLLFLFKYVNFVIGIVNMVAGADIISEIGFTLPIGISFYTFQIASYVIDVYKGKKKKNDGIIPFATYVCMFPQLVAGPIVKYEEVQKRLFRRSITPAKLEYGAEVFIVGLAFKVMLANNISSLWNDVLTVGVSQIDTLTAWLGAWGFSMQIYFDFFGYSLMAMGLGYMTGFELPENFNDPYCTKSVSQFWRNWHITLGRWFRDYVYIPLGGNRRGAGRMVFNTFVVWLLTGLWHGADWNFIIWGMFFFVLIMAEKIFLGKYLEKSAVIGHVYMVILIPISWVIFNISDLTIMVKYLSRMLLFNIGGFKLQIFSKLSGRYWWMMLICIFFATPYPKRIFKKYKHNVLMKILLAAVFVLSVYEVANGKNNPFLYFRF